MHPQRFSDNRSVRRYEAGWEPTGPFRKGGREAGKPSGVLFPRGSACRLTKGSGEDREWRVEVLQGSKRVFLACLGCAVKPSLPEMPLQRPSSGGLAPSLSPSPCELTPPHNASPPPTWRSSPARERPPASMSWHGSLCREVGAVVARLLGCAVLLCVLSNAVFLFYLPSRRRRGSDGRSESRQRADSQEGAQASPAEQRSEALSAERRRSTAGQRSGGGGPDGWLGSAADQPKRMVLFQQQQLQLPGRASQAGGGLWPPALEKPARAIADARRLSKAGRLGESASFPRQRDREAGLPRGQ